MTVIRGRTGEWIRAAAVCCWFMAVGLPASAFAVMAPASVVSVGPAMQQALGPELEIYRDVRDTLSVVDLEQSPDKFRPERAPEYFGIHSGTLWVRLTLRNASAAAVERWLLVDNCLQEEVSLYQPETDGGFMVARSGARVAPAHRSVPTSAIVFPVNLSSGETKTVYIAIRGRAITAFNLQLWVPGAYLQDAQRQVALQSFATGLNVLLLLVCVFAAKGRRRWALVLGGLGHVFLSTYSLVREGYGMVWLHGGAGLYPQYAMQLFLALTWLCPALFARTFLDIPRRSRFWSGALQAMAAGFALLALFSFAFFVPWLTALTTLAALTVLTWVCWVHGDDAAKRGYLVWCLLIWVGLLVTFAKGKGLLPLDSDAGLVATLLGVVLASLVLTFAFYRNVLHVQQTAVAEQRRVVKLRRNEAARLRLAVREKTREIGAALEAAQRAAADKTQFLSMMAHELRAPLHVILGNLRLFTNDRALQEDARFAAIMRSSGRLQRLIDHALAYGAGKAQSITAEPVATHLSRLLDEVVEEARLTFRRDAKRLHARVSGELPEYVVVDGVLLVQVLENLLANADKYGGNETIEFQVEALVGGRSSGAAEMLPATFERIRFAVRDKGPGIPPEDQQSIFEPFTRLASTRHQPGQGLGLTVAREAVRALGGDLHLESSVGAGCCFHFELVLQVISAPQAPGLEAECAALSLPPATVLSPLLAMLELGEILAIRKRAADLRQAHPEWADYWRAVEGACAAVDLAGLARLLQASGAVPPVPATE